MWGKADAVREGVFVMGRPLMFLPDGGAFFLPSSLILLAVLAGCGSPSTVVVGSKNFTEQVILGELVAQTIETHARVSVERRFHLGGTFICDTALESGEIDVYVEYTGTALTAILKEPPRTDSGEVFRRVREAYRQRELEWLDPLGFNNTFAILIRGEEARALGISTISEAVPHARRWRAGFGYEFMEREDGFKGLVETYGLEFAGPPRVMELGLIYRALAEGRIDLTAGDSTSGLIEVLDLAALQDDRSYFPPYDAAVVIRRDTLARHPDLRPALEQLSGKLDEAAIRRLNYAVDGARRPVREVVQEFLGALEGPGARRPSARARRPSRPSAAG